MHPREHSLTTLESLAICVLNTNRVVHKTHPVANKAEMIKKIMVFINLFRQTLQLILINVLNFLRLDAQIIKPLTLGTVVKTYHKSGQVNAECYPLVVAPCFSQSVRTEVPFKVDFTTPAFHQLMHRWHG